MRVCGVRGKFYVLTEGAPELNPNFLIQNLPNLQADMVLCCVVSLLIYALPSLRVSQPIDPRVPRFAAEGMQSPGPFLQRRDAEPKHHPQARHLSNAHNEARSLTASQRESEAVREAVS